MQQHFQIVTWRHLPKSPNSKQDEVEEGEGNSLGSCAANEILKESHSATGHYSLNGLKGLKGTKRGDSVGRESSREDCCRHEREKENQRGALLSLLPLSVFPSGSGRGALSSFRTPSHSDPILRKWNLQRGRRGECGTIPKYSSKVLRRGHDILLTNVHENYVCSIPYMNYFQVKIILLELHTPKATRSAR